MDWRVGLALCFGVVLAGCYRDSDDFHTKVAAKMCSYNARGPDRPFLDYTEPVVDTTSEPSDPLDFSPPEYQPYSGPWCEDAVISNLERCDASCEYSPRKARRCLRKINRALRDGTYNDSELAVCDRVYSCGNVTSETSQSCRISTQSCAVGGEGSPVALTMLLLAGGWARRRRRR
jgi:MYXO-CTERM domain-containing protein